MTFLPQLVDSTETRKPKSAPTSSRLCCESLSLSTSRLTLLLGYPSSRVTDVRLDRLRLRTLLAVRVEPWAPQFNSSATLSGSARENQLEDLFDSPDRPKPTPHVPSPTTSIHAETSVLTNINHLAEQLRLSSSSSIGLVCTLADTRAAATHNLISQRLKILDRLIDKYGAILLKMEAGESSGHSSPHPMFIKGSSKDVRIVEGVRPVAQTGSEKDVEMEVLNDQAGNC